MTVISSEVKRNEKTHDCLQIDCYKGFTTQQKFPKMRSANLDGFSPPRFRGRNDDYNVTVISSEVKRNEKTHYCLQIDCYEGFTTQQKFPKMRSANLHGFSPSAALRSK